MIEGAEGLGIHKVSMDFLCPAKLYFNHTYWSENFWGVISSARFDNGADTPRKMIIRC